VVIGGGLAGVTTLHELARRGVQATLLEARDDLALETSFANGGMMTPSMSDPWNNPGVGRHLASSLFNPHSPMKLRLRAVPSLAVWGLRFLRNSTPRRHRAATLASHGLAVRSVERTWELGETLGLSYDASDIGTLKIFDSRDEMGEALLIAKLLETQGLAFRVLDADEVVGVEPQLADVRSRIAGGIHFPDDRCGDANLFTHALADEAVRLGAEIQSGVRVNRVLTEADRVTGVATSQGRLPTRRVVLAAAHASVGLAGRVGVRLPIKPVKGYSLTFEVRGAPRPRIPVIDEAMHAAVVPLGERLRVVGTAEFTGHDMRLHPRRIENLERLFARLYPALVSHIDPATTVPWTGLRPVTPDGLPHVGSSRVTGLWINSGHGHLGWTMAVGSAGLLVDLMLDKTPDVDPQPFRVAR